MNDELIQYVRKNRKGQKVRAGVMLARKITVVGKNKRVKVLVGWSKCKLKTDKFNSVLGVEIAANRILNRMDGDKRKSEQPDSIKDNLKAFVARAKRYFKTENVKIV